MAWRETDVMKERVKFLLEWERQWQAGEGRVAMAALCRSFGITRQTGYVWVRRYEEAGHNGTIRRQSLHNRPTTSLTRVRRWTEDQSADRLSVGSSLSRGQTQPRRCSGAFTQAADISTSYQGKCGRARGCVATQVSAVRSKEAAGSAGEEISRAELAGPEHYRKNSRRPSPDQAAQEAPCESAALHAAVRQVHDAENDVVCGLQRTLQH